MADAHANFAYGTVLTAPSPATSGTSLVLNSGQGATMPTPPFNVTIWPAGVAPTSANAEIARCTNVATDTLTLTRATESTSARTVVVGDQVAVAVTAKVLTDIETAAAAAQTTANAAAVKANNLSDLASASSARTNLGLGSAATQASSAFDTAGAAATEQTRATAAEALAAQKASNLSDLASAASARTNLGLGTAATHADTDYAPASGIAESAVTNLVTDLAAKLVKASNLSDVASAATARTNLGLGSAATHTETDFASTYRIAPNTFALPSHPSLWGSTGGSPNANDARWARILIDQTGQLRDVYILIATTGGNVKVGVLDTGQANGTHTTRTCLAISGSLAVPIAGLWQGFDPNIAVTKGDTLEFFFAFDGTVAKAATPTAPTGAGTLPTTNFTPSSGAGTSNQKICGTIAAANVPSAVNNTVTDAQMVAAGAAMGFSWRIS